MSKNAITVKAQRLRKNPSISQFIEGGGKAKTSARKKVHDEIEGAELAPLLNDLLEDGTLGDFLDHIGLGADGLPPDCDGRQLMATVKQFYVGDGELDMAVVADDLATYPPIAAQIRRGRREKYQERQQNNAE